MWLKRLMVVVAALCFSAGAFNAAAQEQGDAAGQLAGILKGYRTYQANFIQILVNESGGRVQETHGTLKAKRPGLFYWETKAPLSQFIVSDGERVSVYDPDLEQVTIQQLDSRASSTPALLLSGEVDDLAESYEISQRALGESTLEFTLKPRNPDSLFVSLRLSFFNGELQEMRMEDSLSQFSILSFDDIELNAELPDTAFTLQYPDDVDIIRDEV